MHQQKLSKLAVVGLGYVGELIAFTSIVTNCFEEIYLYNRDSRSTEGRSKSDAKLRNLTDAAAWYDVKIRKCESYKELPNDAVTMVCIKEAYDYRYVPIDRMREVTSRKDAPLMRKIAEAYANKDFSGEVFMVTNPVNPMSYLFRHYSGVESARIHPVGAILDCSRYRKFVKDAMNDPRADVDVMVAGEHGPSLVFLRNSSKVNGKPLSSLAIDLDAIERRVLEEGPLIARTLGYTHAGIVECVLRLSRIISLPDYDKRVPFGTEHNGVFMELPVKKSKGSYDIVWHDFSTGERALLERSASKVEEGSKKILADATQRQRRSIIIVDDEPAEPESLAASLEECILDDKALRSSNDFNFDFAHGGEQFIEKVMAEPIGYDLAIVDQRMPRISGLDSVIKARQYQPELDCIILSGKSEMKDLQNMVNHERLSFIEKPFFDPAITDLQKQPSYLEFKRVLERTQQKIA